MGSSCGILKPKDEDYYVVIPIKSKRYVKIAPPPEEKNAKFGKYYAETSSNKNFTQSWRKILFTQESAIIRNDKKFRSELNNFISRGIPVEFRWRVWSNILIREKYYTEEQYLGFKCVGEPHISTIRRDLDRSFPQEPYFDLQQYGMIGQMVLERVLAKFAFKYSEVGYCQGMNFLAGFLLLVSGGAEIEVFQMLECLFKNFSLAGFFEEGMEGLKKHIWVTKRLINKFFPRVYSHLEQECIPDDLWLFKWLMTIFTMILPANVLVRIWDVFLVKGVKFLYRTVLGIISLIQDEVLSRDSGEICNYLADIRLRITSPEELFKSISEVKLNKSIIHKFDYQGSMVNSHKILVNEKVNSPKVQLPPLRINRNKVVSKFAASPQIKLKRTLSGCLSTLHLSPRSPNLKPSKVPRLPEIKRNLVSQKSFGLTNRSCELSMKKFYNIIDKIS